MSRRRKIALLVLAAVIVLGAVLLRWLLDPAFLVPRILALAGSSLGLEITADGESDYRLRGTPQLVARNVVAREPGSEAPLLRADRVFISLPWSTLRARGSDLTAQRLELDAPVLDVPALQRWLAKRPSSETRIPTLSRGIAIARGRIMGGDWKIEDVNADVPLLAPRQPVRVHLRGRYAGGNLRAPVDVYATLTEPGSGAGVGIVGDVALEHPQWRLPSEIRLSARLRNEEGLRLDHAVLGAQSRYVSADASLPFAFGLAGPLRLSGGTIALQPAGMALRGEDAMPTLDAAGGFSITDLLRLNMEGRLAEWPSAWPALPPPLGQSSSPLPFALHYEGASDLSEVADLRLQRDETVFDGRFRLFELMEWSETAAIGSPLPPLTGTLKSPRLEVSGAVLEGVELQLDDPGIPAAPHSR